MLWHRRSEFSGKPNGNTLCTVRVVCRAILLVCGFCPIALADGPSQNAITEAPITPSDREHWSFTPLLRPPVPEVDDPTWVQNAIDSFLLAKMESSGLVPMPQADRYTLIRRVTFDLTGLPPTPAQIRAFIADEAPSAYERLVDRLLACSAYGERQAQHWLDLARFAETDGFEHDNFRPNAWKYRDWVIDALNEDIPFDEFVRLQLAGDELKPDDPSAAIATGFLLCGPDMPDINLQEERRHTFLNEMASTVGSVFMGLQVGCAQCHDHKYDPVSQLDFYRLRAFFENADLFTDHVVASSQASDEQERVVRERAMKWKAAEQALRDFENAALARLHGDKDHEDGGGEFTLTQAALIKQLSPKDARTYFALIARVDRAKSNYAREVPFARTMKESGDNVRPSYLRIRGDFRRKGPEVHPAYVRVVNLHGESVPPPRPGAPSSGRRTALANWLTEPDHPLTTRVAVNRIWQQHFGVGIVGTPSDFGAIGDSPSHPKLLDWLATEFVRLGWSQKQLHRLIVTSAAYRQASRPTDSYWSDGVSREAQARWRIAQSKDSQNELLSRMRRQRLEGESIRDAMLLAGNGLSRRKGGPGVRPPLPEELVSTLLKNQWSVSEDPEDHRRRSLYLFVRRNLQYPLFELFDKPDTNASCPRRNQSTTAPQALVLFNSELALSAAREMAGDVLRQAGHEWRDVVAECYLRTLGRPPRSGEMETALTFLTGDAERLRDEHRESSQLALPIPAPVSDDIYQSAALTDLCLALFNLNEFAYVD